MVQVMEQYLVTYIGCINKQEYVLLLEAGLLLSPLTGNRRAFGLNLEVQPGTDFTRGEKH